MTDEQKPVTHTEQWVFGGSRVGRSGKRLHCWVDPDGEDLLYAPKGRYAIGSVYEAEVVRHDNGGVTRYGQPRYTGARCDDEALVDRLAAQHRAAEVELDLAARERADRRDDPLERAIERLVEVAAHVPHSQRTGFAVYVATRLMRSWR